MKKIFVSLFAVLAVFSNNSFASNDVVSLISENSAQMLVDSVAPLNLINWKVGDTANFDVSAGNFGKLGTMVKSVTSEEGNAIWVEQKLDLGFQKDNSKMLMSRADGKILKFIHNGKEEALPDDKVEIISQDSQDVTVPAGTFQSIHIVAKTTKVKKIEAWINPRDTVMEGAIKQIISTDQIDITLELSSFKRN